MRVISYAIITMLMFVLIGLGLFFGFWAAVSYLVGSLNTQWLANGIISVIAGMIIGGVADRLENAL